MGDKERELAIFILCKSLVDLLGEEQAIADLTILYQRHPEMFRNEEEVKEVIDKVVSEPDLIKVNPKAKNDKDFMVAKMLDSKKMGDVGVRNDEGINIIFHANKKNISQLNKFKKEAQTLVETPSAKAAPTWLDHCADNSSELSKCDKAPSTSASSNIAQSNLQSQANDENITSPTDQAIKYLKDKIKNLDMSKYSKNKDNKDKGFDR